MTDHFHTVYSSTTFPFFPVFSLQLLAATTATRRKTFCSRVFFRPAAVGSFRDCYYALRFFVKSVSHRVLTMEILCEFSNLYSKLNQTEASTIMDGSLRFCYTLSSAQHAGRCISRLGEPLSERAN